MVSKQKLTLSVDREAVSKAKEMGLNLSEVTEKILLGFTFDNEEVDDEILRDNYHELLQTMLPLMKKHDFKVKIGENSFIVDDILVKSKIFFLSNGMVYDTWTDEEYNDLKKYDLWNLFSPKLILKKFLEELSEIENKRKRFLKEIEMTKKIVEAISDVLNE
jgi:hypothetical protein